MTRNGLASGHETRMIAGVKPEPRASAAISAPGSARAGAPGAADTTGGGGLSVGRSAPQLTDYELLRCIGLGAYGEVWLARGLTGVYRAVKIVWRDRFTEAEPFEREFRGVKESMAHALEAGQLALLHVGQDEAAGFFYYVMELADDATGGRTIEPARYVPLTLKELKARRGRLPAADCLDLAVGLTRTLATLHSRGLVHRDIKPSNVIVVNGAPKLADVGLVASATEARTFVGTQGYLPPEGPGTPAADVYALGKVLYELATGFEREEFPRLPAEFKDAADRRALFELNEILLRACEPSPDQRYRDAAALLADLVALQTGRSPRTKRVRRAVASSGLVLAAVAALAAFAWWKSHPAPVPSQKSSATKQSAASAEIPATMSESAPVVASEKIAPAPISPQSIAILPFENLSGDKENGYLADGLQEDMLTNLAAIRGLKVAPRASAMHYRGTTKSIRQIGVELGVAFLLNGSVRREANKIRVSAELVDARTEQQVWARKYDRELSDVLGLQSALADEIVPALQLVLSPEEKAALSSAPTSNLTAYELFLRAKRLHQQREGGDENAFQQTEDLLRQAVTADPGFMRAWVELAMVHADRYGEVEKDHKAARIALAEEAIEAARRLAPNAPEVLLGLGRIRQMCYNDLSGARFYYQQIRTEYPHYPDVHLPLGQIYRRLGRWAEAIAEFREAWQQEPGDSQAIGMYSMTLGLVHRYEDVYTLMHEVVKLVPDNIDVRFFTAFTEFRRNGTRDQFDRLLANLPPDQRNSRHVADLKFDWAIETGDEALLLNLIKEYGVTTEHIDAVVAVLASGQKEHALKLLEKIKPEIDRSLAANPLGYLNWTLLAKYHALHDDRPAALKAVDRARQLMPESSDAMNGQEMARQVAQVLTWLGDTDAALTEIERLLKKPGMMHVWRLRSNVAWRSLRGNPRFEALLADPENYAPLKLSETAPLPSPTERPGSPDPTAAASALSSTSSPAPEDGNAGQSSSTAASPALPDPEKTLAVLPFANLSENPEENYFFTDGICDDILTSLAYVRDLHVISRGTITAYRGTTRPAAEVSRELRAGYVLTGSVRRAGSMVRVTVRLVRAATDEQLWARSYDRDLQGVLTVQSEIAQAIASELRVALSPAEKGLLVRRPTMNPAAYDLYLKARELRHSGQSARADLEKEIAYLNSALALDANCTPALAELTYANAFLHFGEYEPADGPWLQAAKEALERARQLAPDDPEVIQATGDYYYYGHRDYARAVGQYQRLLNLRPNDAEMHWSLGFVLRRQGRWADSAAHLRRAVQLEPGNVSRSIQLAGTLGIFKRYDEAEAAARQLVREHPKALLPAFSLARATLWARGSAAELEQFSRGDFDPGEESMRQAYLRHLVLLSGDYPRFLEMEEQRTPEKREDGSEAHDALLAQVLADSGNWPAARVRAGKAVKQLQASLAGHPGDPDLWSALSQAYAVLGAKADALRCANKAVELLPESADAMSGPTFALNRASVLARVGEAEQAIAELRRLLRVPGGAHVALVRLGGLGAPYAASFAPLRGNPKFEALLNDPRANAPITPGEPPLADPEPAASAPPPVSFQIPTPADDKSVLVLPFENLGPEPDGV
jgi:TolB-like protein/cytochrome c-type biogenesis protein CcmH/NrfG